MATTSRAESVGFPLMGRAFATGMADPFWPKWEPAPASEADHAAIHRFLQSVSVRLHAADFQSQIDAPQYDPADRLVVKNREEIIAHVMLSSRLLRFCGLEVRATDVKQLATLPEYRDRGLAKRLLEDALKDMRGGGSLVATTRTPCANFYLEQGWFSCGDESVGSISPQKLLSHLEVSRSLRSPTWKGVPRSLLVRPWRQHEIEELAEIYDAGTSGSFGPWIRRPSHWRWLMSRPDGCSKAYVVVDRTCPGKTPLDFDQSGRLAGYCVLRGNRIVEVITAPDDQESLNCLLSAVSYEAMETGRHTIELAAPQDHPAFQTMLMAGATVEHHAEAGANQRLAKVLDVDALIKTLRPLLWERAQSAGLESGESLFVCAGSQAYELAVQKRSVSVNRVNASRGIAAHGIELAPDLLGPLLLGSIRVVDLIRDELVQVSSAAALRLAAAFFPRLTCWRPTLEESWDTTL